MPQSGFYRSFKIFLQPLAAIALLSHLALILPLHAQAPSPAPPTPTDAERALAKQLTALPEQDALKQIAAADPSTLTEGLYLAMREIDVPIINSDPARALIILHEVDAIARRAGMALHLAEAHYTAAIATMNLGRLDDALLLFDETLNLFKDANAPPIKFSRTYTGKGIADLKAGDLLAAIDDDTEAANLAHQSGDALEEGRALIGLGNAQQAISNNSDAEKTFTQALNLFRENKIVKGEAFVLNNLSVLYEHQGNYPLAIQFCEQSLAIKRTLGNDAHLASSFINLANYYHMVGRDADAMKALSEAESNSKISNDNEGLAKAAAERGIILLETHHLQEALKWLLHSAKISKGFEDYAGRSQTLEKIAEADLQLKNFSEALQYAKQAMAISQDAGDLEGLALARRTIGLTYQLLGNYDDARKELENSVSITEQMRSKLAGGADERQLFLSERVSSYQLLSSVAAEQKDWPAALAASEQAKGRTLLDLYNAGNLASDSEISPQESAEENRLRTRYRALDLQVDNLSSQKNFDPGRKVALNTRLQEARSNFLVYRDKLYDNHPALRLRRADLGVINPSQMQKLLPDPKTLLLEYELTDYGAYLYVISHGASQEALVIGYKLSASTAAISRHARKFRDQLATRDPKFSTEAQWLYQTLLTPARQQLKTATTLVIVPDGNLWQIPFEALQNSNSHFLVEKSSITTVPSLTVLLAVESAPKSQNKQQRLLAFANPLGQTQEQTDEAAALKKLYGNSSSEVYFGKDATLARFRQKAPSFDVVHIAAHGIFNDKSPLSSYMLLASANGNEKQGWLRADEIQSLQLRADILVLSGCETGKGAFKEGEGLVGMSWAALAAGSRATLASSWRVEASSTTNLMLDFHRNLLAGATRAEALRLAELKLLKIQRYSHPYYWAPFVLMGDGGR